MKTRARNYQGLRSVGFLLKLKDGVVGNKLISLIALLQWYVTQLANGLVFDDSFAFVQTLKAHLDGGKKLPFPDGILINGRGPNQFSLTFEQGVPSISF